MSAAATAPQGAPFLKRLTSRFLTHWRQSVAGIIGAGQVLTEGKRLLPHGEFEAWVKRDLPIDGSTARRLMSVASDERIRAHAHELPPSWATLYELTKLTDSEFASRIEDGTINVEMQRKDIVRTEAEPTAPRPRDRTAEERLAEYEARIEKSQFEALSNLAFTIAEMGMKPVDIAAQCPPTQIAEGLARCDAAQRLLWQVCVALQQRAAA